jgi:hypothetical protein
VLGGVSTVEPELITEDIDKLRQARKLVFSVLETVPVGLLYDRYFLALDKVIDDLDIAMDHHDALEEP